MLIAHFPIASINQRKTLVRLSLAGACAIMRLMSVFVCAIEQTQFSPINLWTESERENFFYLINFNLTINLIKVIIDVTHRLVNKNTTNTNTHAKWTIEEERELDEITEREREQKKLSVIAHAGSDDKKSVKLNGFEVFQAAALMQWYACKLRQISHFTLNACVCAFFVVYLSRSYALHLPIASFHSLARKLFSLTYFLVETILRLRTALCVHWLRGRAVM